MRISKRLSDVKRRAGCRMKTSRMRLMSAKKSLAFVLVEIMILQPLIVGVALAGPKDATVVTGDVSIDTNGTICSKTIFFERTRIRF